jgi:hypothetical protein
MTQVQGSVARVRARIPRERRMLPRNGSIAEGHEHSDALRNGRARGRGRQSQPMLRDPRMPYLRREWLGALPLICTSTGLTPATVSRNDLKGSALSAQRVGGLVGGMKVPRVVAPTKSLGITYALRDV